MKTLQAFALLLACCLTAQAALPAAGVDPPAPKPKAKVAAKAVLKASLILPASVAGEAGDYIEVAAATEGKVVRWVALDAGLKLFPVHLLKDSRTAVVSAAKAGRYRLLAYTAIGGEPSEPATCTVVVGNAPDPGPGPKPPDPPPNPVGGLRVLIVYESADLARMPEAQQAVLYGMAVRSALNKACEPDGLVRGWRIFDKDVDASGDTKGWAELLARPRAAVPWVVMTRGGTVAHEGPLPATAEEFLALLADKAKGVRRG